MMRLVIAFLLLAGAGAAAAQERAPVSTVPLSRMDTPWWRARHLEKLALLRAGPVDLVWLGDSITQNWEASGPAEWMDFSRVWQQYYGSRHALNLGFKGDTTQHVLWRIANGELDGIAPRAVVVLVGANNLGRVRNTAAQTVAGIEAVVGAVRSKVPGAHVVLVGVLPSVRSMYVTRTTERTNAALVQRFGGAADVTYIDATALFVRDGIVDRSSFYDDRLSPPEPPLHPTPAAMGRLAALIEPVLARSMGRR